RRSESLLSNLSLTYCAEHTLNCADAAPHLGRNGSVTLTLPVEFADALLLLLTDSGAAELDAMCFSSCHARLDPFLDHRPLELGKHTHHLEQRAARRRGSVQRLLMQIKIDARFVQLLQRLQKPLQAPPEAVH